MRIDVTYTDTAITFVLKFNDEDLTLSKEEEQDETQKWSQMLRSCLKVTGVNLYPIYELESCLLYLFGWVDSSNVDTLKDPEAYVTHSLALAKQKQGK